MQDIAHIRQSDGKIQSVAEHLLDVMKLAEHYGEKLGVKHIAGLAGLLHDVGKYSQAFRNYIFEAVHNPENAPEKGSVDHSTAGGKLLFDRCHGNPEDKEAMLLAEVVGNAIISHHSYLHNYLNNQLESDFLNRVKHKEINEYENIQALFFEHVICQTDFNKYISVAKSELLNYRMRQSSDSFESKMMFLTKYIFSALIDADRSNTRQFEDGDQLASGMTSAEERAQIFKLFDVRLDAYLHEIQNDADQSGNLTINRLRREMSEQCAVHAEKPSGIYTLSIPTGGGKTLASLRYALKHAITYGKKQIIYVVPYTTIIEQNAAEVRRILRDEVHILEHHSNVIADEGNDESDDGRMTKSQKLKLAQDNWNSPIIFTTMVQFLNVFYAKGTRNIRRLHNLSEAVIIFDEVQKVPVHCVALFNQALNFLHHFGGSSMILCTATQPALEFVEHKLDLKPDAEVIERIDEVVEAFRRVEIIDHATEGAWSTERLEDFTLETCETVRNVLIVLNTKSVVRQLYRLLSKLDIPVYHLSTGMCAAHRNVRLETIREHLRKGERVICISTQLIEAGVDVDFDCVIRSLSGLDSIAQAAGRCNRHGKRGIQHVHVFDHGGENLDKLREIKKGKVFAKRILADLRNNSTNHGGSILSQEAMKRYFKDFYRAFESDLNYPITSLNISMAELLFATRKSNQYHLSYKSKTGTYLPLVLTNSYGLAAQHFQVIDSSGYTVLVPYGRGAEIITELNAGQSIPELSRMLREAQQYSVQLFKYEWDELSRDGGIVPLLDGKMFALKAGAYNEEFGLDISYESPMGAAII